MSRSDHTHSYSLPTASSSTLGGVKIGSNINISSGKISVPTASGTAAGVTIVYPSASCTTYSSDSGTVTPAAVQKGAKMFAITRPTKMSSSDPYPGTAFTPTDNAVLRWDGTDGNVQNSKITIEDVTNTANSNKANVLVIPAEGNKKMVYGYCTDQVDGTSFIGGVFDASATSYPYASGLAIGGTSGNLLWKGKRVLDNNDLTTLNNSISAKANSSHNQASNTINAMTGYSKPSSTSAIATTDTLNAAIGKLEKALDGKGTSNLAIGTTSTTAAAGNHTHSSYAPLASPTFTGTPKAPTAAAGTNTTQIATTAFVTTAINNAITAAIAASY